MTVLLRFYYDHTRMVLLLYYSVTMIVLQLHYCLPSPPPYYGWVPQPITPGGVQVYMQCKELASIMASGCTMIVYDTH